MEPGAVDWEKGADSRERAKCDGLRKRFGPQADAHVDWPRHPKRMLIGLYMEPSLIAKVRFELLPGEVSGKTCGYLSNVRPNHYIAELGYTVIGNVVFDNGGVELGEVVEATISYAYHEPLAHILIPGLRYEVREGSRLVGFVEVESVPQGSAA